MKRTLLLALILLSIGNLRAQQVDLQYFIDKALSNSPLLKDIMNRQRAIEIDSMRIRAGFGPQVNAVSNNYYAPVIKGWGYDEVVTDKANISAQVSVAQELIGRLNRENQYRALTVQNHSLQNEQKITEQELIRDISDQYIITYGDWQNLGFNEQVLTLLSKEEVILKKLTESNVYRQTDYLTFLLTVKDQEYKYASSLSQYRNDLATLNYLCGIEDTVTVILNDPEIAVSNLPDIRNSVFYQSFVNDSLMYLIEDKQIDFEYKPKISLFTDAGYYSSLYYQPWKNFGVSAGISLSVPIYDGHQKKMQHDRVTISEQTLQSYRDFYLKQYYQQISRLFAQLDDNIKLNGILNKQLEYSNTLINANHKLLETGDLQIADYVIAVNNLLSVRNESVKNKIEQYIIINHINYWNRIK